MDPGRMASPSACASASMSASIRASDPVCRVARSLVSSSRSADARSVNPLLSSMSAAAARSASSAAETRTRRRSASERSRQWRLLSSLSVLFGAQP